MKQLVTKRFDASVAWRVKKRKKREVGVGGGVGTGLFGGDSKAKAR